MGRRVVKVGLQASFERHTRIVYDGMAARVRRRCGLAVLPFSVAQYRDWLLTTVFGSWDRAAQCMYCTQLVNVATFETDHLVALSCGGSVGLDNLGVCCAPCNRLKGALSADGFRRLIVFATEELHPRDANEIFGRLKNGGAYLRLKMGTKKPPQRALVSAEDLTLFQ
jgi:5-methylcytosine-specific restriction endonuclease McrA